MDINSFVTGFAMGKKKGGSGGGSAVLGELTVTENGVYDEPVATTVPEIAVGSTLQFNKEIVLSEELKDVLLSTFCYSDGWFSVVNGNEDAISGVVHTNKSYTVSVDKYSTGDSYAYVSEGIVAEETDYAIPGYEPHMHGWYKIDWDANISTPCDPVSVTVDDSYDDNAKYILKLLAGAFFGTSVQFDGWNKVTVDVAPTIGELVVTENGVYDNPTTYAVPEIDLGATLQFKESITLSDELRDTLKSYDGDGRFKINDYGDDRYYVHFEADGSYWIRGIISYPDDQGNYYDMVYVPEDMIAILGKHPLFNITTAGWYKLDTRTYTPTPCDPPSFVVKSADDIDRIKLVADACFGTLVPADGWNKVTVNVAGGGDNTVIDVESLPTENVDETKIYRVTETPDLGIGIYVRANGIVMSLNDYGKSVGFPNITYVYYVVESLPDTLNICNPASMLYYVYIVPSNGRAYTTLDGVNVDNFMEAAMEFSPDQYRGTVSNSNEITLDGYYFCTASEPHIIYGIPNNATVQRFVDGAWVELT